MENKAYESDLMRAHSALKRNGVIIYPTDTIWGIGCDATLDLPVERIFQMKNRPSSMSMIVLVADWAMASQYADPVPAYLQEEIEASPRAVTLVVSGAKGLAPALVAPDGSIGLRIPRDPFCQDLLARLGRPLVSTSANLSGVPFGGSYADIAPVLLQGADYVVEWRQEERVISAPSRVLKLNPDGSMHIIRD
ncbi:MAG: Sua5/YciO/YrdC/YwlC family protein [Bacteroidia bacterium]|nr:Sua5/YciO/YrdC/YwlC family protein [Bacteroidia bacterium]